MQDFLRPLLQLAISAFLVLVGCSSLPPLTSSERAKLDAPLLELIQTNGSRSAPAIDTMIADGVTLYRVIVRANDQEAVRQTGAVISSAFADVLVVTASLEQLRALIASPAVRALESGTQNHPH